MTQITEKIISFVRSIGIEVRIEAIAEETTLPGIRIERGGLVVDPERCRYPGDILHEAGHLAVAPPSERAIMDGAIDPQKDLAMAGELMTLPWTYAAALHIGIDPAIVFHQDGYHGGSSSLLQNFSQGHFIGLPMLEWSGMAVSPERASPAGPEAFPKMISWVRINEADALQ